MMLLGLNKIGMDFAGRTLFSDVTLSVSDKDKIGLIGLNGTGKTTLFKIITGALEPARGDVNINSAARVGYMEQFAPYDATSILEETVGAFAELLELEQRLEKIERELQAGRDAERNAQRYRELSEEFERKGGLTFRARARSALLGLGFEENELNRGMGTLSGGQRTRVALAKMLLGDYNLLLLDEPTNHLDMASVEWLEDFLRSYSGAFIVISHDRYFLDRVTMRTVEITNGTAISYAGSYSEFMRKKAEINEAAKNHYENTQKEIKRLEGVIAQQKRWNRERNLRTAEAKRKEIERLKRGMGEPLKEDKRFAFELKVSEGGGQDVLSVSGINKRFGDKEILRGVSFTVRKGERVFIIGPNGCGKSTLLNIITGALAPDGGEIKLSARVTPGYYDQTLSGIDGDKSALDEIMDAYALMTQGEIRNALAAFGFTGDDVFKRTGELSGGEKARIALIKLMLSEANFLILDEPTNHLDIGAREALEEALKSYEGTLLVVSHDRYLINSLATRLYAMDSGFTEYLGNYDYYKDKKADSLTVKARAARPKSGYAEKKEKEACLRKAKKELLRTEEEIERAEEDIKGMERALYGESASDYELILELSELLETKKSVLAKLYEQWNVLDERLKNWAD